MPDAVNGQGKHNPVNTLAPVSGIRYLHGNLAQRILRDMGMGGAECYEPDPLHHAVLLTPPEQGAPGSGEDFDCSYCFRKA
ncbi:hypothetical protein ACVWZX_004940 [Deinococcus sp. UYEF24]